MTVSILRNVHSLPLRQQVEVARYTQALNQDLAKEQDEILGQTHGSLDEEDGQVFTKAYLESRQIGSNC